MPTPFMHLQISEALREPLMSAADASMPPLVKPSQWPAFYFGSVAADYQTICGIPRAQTHYYRMPPVSILEGPQNLLALYPQLYPGAFIDPDLAAFTAAYLVHLYLDLRWHFEVVVPYFAGDDHGQGMHERYLRHLILLAHLDKLAYQSLQESARNALESANVDLWLLFGEEKHLRDWREYLADQLRPGNATKTVEIFAGRLRMTSQAFADKLSDLEWMNEELFSKIPVSVIQQLMKDSVSDSLDLVTAYCRGRLF